MHPFDPYALLALFAAVIIFLLGVFVLSKNTGGLLNKLFFVYVLFVVEYAVTGGYAAKTFFDPESGLLWARLSAVGGIFMGPMFFIFVLVFTRNVRLVRSIFTYLALFGGTIALYLWSREFNPLRPENLIRESWGWELSWETLPLTVPALYAWAIGTQFLGVYFAWQFHRKTSDAQEKKQALFIMLGVFIPITVGAISEIIIPNLGLRTALFETLFSMSAGVLVGAMGYAAFRYRLFTALTPQVAAETIIETMKEALFVTNAHYGIEFMNSFATKLFGYEKNELVGKNISVLAPEAEKFQGDIFPKISSGQSVTDFETTLKNRGAETIAVNISVSPLINERGASLGMVVVVRDIRETRKLIGKLEETTGELKAVKRNLEVQIGKYLELQRKAQA